MNTPIGIGLKDFIGTVAPKEIYEDELIIFELNYINSERDDHNHAMPPVRIDAFSVFFVTEGELTIDIDYVHYHLTHHMVLQLSSYHIMDNISLSRDIKGYLVVISMDIFNLIKSEITSLKSLGMESNLFHPVQQLHTDESRILEEIIIRLRKNIHQADHHYQKYLIKNNVSDFLLELANINIRKNKSGELGDQYGHKEIIIQKFIKLLIANCKKEHQVSFYASALCMTAENLSRIIKDFSGKTANIWISGAILAEAKILLRKPEVTVQEVAEELTFGDQSSFGKFFKKHTGETPTEYKEKVLSNDSLY